MRSALSAARTWGASASASLCTATARSASRRRVRMIRTAISPRLATRTAGAVRSGAGNGVVIAVLRSAAGYMRNDAVAHRVERGVAGGGEGEGEDGAGVDGVDDAVVPQARRGVVGVALLFVARPDGGFERFFLFSGPVFAACGFLVAAYGGEHGGGLFPAHDGDAGVRPHPQEARRVGAPAHAVVSGAEGAADDDGEFGDAGAGDGGDHFRAVFGDAAGFVVAAHHEPGDVLQEDEGDGAPVAQFDEVGAFERGFGEQDAVVGDDADGVTVQVREPGDEGGPVVGFEFGESLASTSRAMTSRTS